MLLLLLLRPPPTGAVACRVSNTSPNIISTCGKRIDLVLSPPFPCLSRACLGKMIVFSTKWLKKCAAFLLYPAAIHQLRGEIHVHSVGRTLY